MPLGPIRFPRRSAIRIPDADPLVFTRAPMHMRRADVIALEWPVPLSIPRRRPIAVPQIHPDFPSEE